MGLVVILKFANGDEVVGEQVLADANLVKIARPLRVALVRDPQTGQPGKALMDWIIMAPDLKEVDVYATQLAAAPVKAPKEVEAAWREQTSGLILPPSQLNG